jgi:hypothetical protein
VTDRVLQLQKAEIKWIKQLEKKGEDSFELCFYLTDRQEVLRS